MIDEKLLFDIVRQYGCSIKKVENEEEAGFIDYDGVLKKSIFEDIKCQFERPFIRQEELSNFNLFDYDLDYSYMAA